MNILFKNAKILTMRNIDKIDDTYKIYDNQNLIVINNKIAFFGNEIETKTFLKNKTAENQSFKLDKEIDTNNNLLMPSFKNAHTHSPMVFIRGYGKELQLLDWININCLPMEKCLDEENVYIFTKLAILEYLSCGTSKCFEMYLQIEAIAKAVVSMGFKCRFCDSLTSYDKDIYISEEYYNKFNNYYLDKDNLISYCLGLHGEYTNNEVTLKHMSDLVHKYKSPFFSHISETKKEVSECIERHKTTPTVYFDSYGLFDYGGGGYHCVHLSDEDVNIFRNKKLYVITNPSSNLKLASGIAPIKKYLNNDIKVGIGTDGAASSNNLNILKEIYLTACLSKYLTDDAASIPASQILDMAIKNSAYAMNDFDSDCIDIDKKADLIMIDLHKANMNVQTDLVSHLVYAVSKDNIKMTMINGKILYYDNHYYDKDNNEIDTEFIINESNRLFNDILKRKNK